MINRQYKSLSLHVNSSKAISNDLNEFDDELNVYRKLGFNLNEPMEIDELGDRGQHTVICFCS